ncbi:hypothetical protein HME9302_02543 [Alteripontixanthobacter maritimus]|uniref:Uncharacterized protein n=1 Tax=Alteripontixanthobacter maritimus TaxID=2161824 RepID=A0A369QA29_9SPHN|nr:hypothetical protein [Alteripontixanthobacter maritimus]RDC58870.1 hypothetical protein HME9302_00045 [Alteripontixanthobacter maritimus]RDC61322.1 hypothetical protein HME9302_02543 [Alteripontixanthobacter maritimus]
MKFALKITAISSLALVLAACGDTDDASVEAEADTVEMPADVALETVEEEPVEDLDADASNTSVAPATTANEAVVTERQIDRAEAAGTQAQDVAARAQAAAAAAARDTTDRVREEARDNAQDMQSAVNGSQAERVNR